MPTYTQFLSPGRSFGSGKGLLRGIKWGGRPVTPRNFNSLLSFSMGSTRPVDAALGLASGKRQHNPIVVTKQKDTASPLLFQACCNGEVLGSIVLNLIQNDVKEPGGKETTVARITLTNASIANYKTFHGLQGPTSNHPRPGSMSVHTNELEEFELVFQKITYNLMGSTSTTDDWTSNNT